MITEKIAKSTRMIFTRVLFVITQIRPSKGFAHNFSSAIMPSENGFCIIDFGLFIST